MSKQITGQQAEEIVKAMLAQGIEGEQLMEVVRKVVEVTDFTK